MTKKNHPFWNHAVETLVKEVRYYADGIIQTINQADFLPNKNRLVKEARRNLHGFLKKIQKSPVAHAAIDLAQSKGTQFLSLLNFPTKRDVAKLNARLNKLEQKFRTVSHPRVH